MSFLARNGFLPMTSFMMMSEPTFLKAWVIVYPNTKFGALDHF